MTGNFDTVIIRGGDEIEKKSTQIQVSDAKEHQLLNILESFPSVKHKKNWLQTGTSFS